MQPNSYNDYRITFHHAFKVKPFVMATLNTNTVALEHVDIEVYAMDVAVDGFTARVISKASAVRSPSIYWIAFAMDDTSRLSDTITRI